MRKALFLSTMLASVLVAGVATADRNEEDQKSSTRGQQIKEKVLEKQRESRASRETSTVRQNKGLENKVQRSRPKGEIYGDQATRSTTKTQATVASGRNMSASNSVNTPKEIQAMLSRINPMYGAYRTSQAAEGTDSYGGRSMVPNGKVEGQRNMSATGAVNTPSEIRAMLRMINPMHGAYRTSQAAEGTDSYGGSEPFATGAMSSGKSTVHFKNERGELKGGDKTGAVKNSKVRETVDSVVKAKLEKAKSR